MNTIYQIDYNEFISNIKKIKCHVDIRYMQSYCGNYVYCVMYTTNRLYKMVIWAEHEYQQVYHKDNKAYVIIDDVLYTLGTIKPAVPKPYMLNDPNAKFIHKNGSIGKISNEFGGMFIHAGHKQQYIPGEIIDQVIETSRGHSGISTIHMASIIFVIMICIAGALAY